LEQRDFGQPGAKRCLPSTLKKKSTVLAPGKNQKEALQTEDIGTALGESLILKARGLVKVDVPHIHSGHPTFGSQALAVRSNLQKGNRTIFRGCPLKCLDIGRSHSVCPSPLPNTPFS
jgi:hypothetical protein